MKMQAGVMSVEMNQTSRRDPDLGASDATGTINSSLKEFVDQLISSPTRVAFFHNWLFFKRGALAKITVLICMETVMLSCWPITANLWLGLCIFKTGIF